MKADENEGGEVRWQGRKIRTCRGKSSRHAKNVEVSNTDKTEPGSEDTGKRWNTHLHSSTLIPFDSLPFDSLRSLRAGRSLTARQTGGTAAAVLLSVSERSAVFLGLATGASAQLSRICEMRFRPSQLSQLSLFEWGE
jgi:hypothetical protein